MLATSSDNLTFKSLGSIPTIRLDSPIENPFASVSSVFITEGKIEAKSPGEYSTLRGESLIARMVEIANRNVARYPNSAKAHIDYGVALASSRAYDQAADEFQKALTLDTSNYVAQLSLTRVEALRGRIDEAESLYRSLAKQFKEDTTALISLASLAMQKNRFDQAEDFLRQALKSKPDFLLGHFQLGVALLQLGKTNEAIKQFKSAARAGVNSAASYHALGMAYKAQKDFPRAIRSFRLAYSLNPRFEETVAALATTLVETRQPAEAVEVIEGYLADNSSAETRIFEILSRAHFDSGNYRQSRAMISRLLSRTASSVPPNEKEEGRLINNIGACFASEGDQKRSEEFFRKSIQKCASENPAPYNNLARFYLRSGNEEKAVEVLQSSKKWFPNDHSVTLLLAYSLTLLNRFDQAASELKNAIALGDAPPEVYAELGCIYTDAKNDVNSALGILEDGFKRYGKSLFIINNLAYAYLRQGNTNQARTIFAALPRHHEMNEVLSATWGLLLITEGLVNEGKKFYQAAETTANQQGKRQLSRTIRIKMHLELARACLRKDDSMSAKEEILQGLSVKGFIRPGGTIYQRDLEHLRTSLKF